MDSVIHEVKELKLLHANGGMFEIDQLLFADDTAQVGDITYMRSWMDQWVSLVEYEKEESCKWMLVRGKLNLLNVCECEWNGCETKSPTIRASELYYVSGVTSGSRLWIWKGYCTQNDGHRTSGALKIVLSNKKSNRYKYEEVSAAC